MKTMHTTIFANGEMTYRHVNLKMHTKIIAADGGAHHCLNLEIIPQVVIGDFDSLTPEELRSLENAGAQLIRYPVFKNETDLELALIYAIEHGATEITLFGLLGGRWDMSFANILLLASPRFEGIQFRVIHGNFEMFILRGGETLTLTGNPDDSVSVIPLGTHAEGITYTGLEWGLTKESLSFGSPKGVSNRIVNREAQINLDSGVLLVTIQHQEVIDPGTGR
jgi:thiamine pyrophosphokinase